ncbi:MAG TPA: hypothetical protein VGB67_09925 [Fibrella sp.]|jgi:hypothetical protein
MAGRIVVALLAVALLLQATARAQIIVSGQILDKITSQPIPFVSVALFRQPDSVVFFELFIPRILASPAGHSITGKRPS